MRRKYTRRHVLAGLGVMVIGIGASVALVIDRSRAYTNYTVVPDDENDNGGEES